MPDNLDLSKLRAPSPPAPLAVPHETSQMVPVSSIQSVNLMDVLRDNEIIDVTPSGVVLVQPRNGSNGSVQLAAPNMAEDTGPNLREKGYSVSGGQSSYSGIVKGEYNPRLQGLSGLKVYDEMRRSDAQIRSTLRLVKTPILAGKWYMEPASDSNRDQMISEFVWRNMTQWMSSSWPQMLLESLLMLDFGVWVFEKVFDYKQYKGSQRTIWRKWASRHPVDITDWLYDGNGGLQGIKMAPNFNISAVAPQGPATAGFGDASKQPELPIQDLLVFTFDKEAGNMQGISLLRSDYKAWYFKENLYKIDAIQKERHGIGIPIIKLPPQWQPADKLIADQMGRNLRTNESAHIVLPPMWEIAFAELKGQLTNALSSIEHHDSQIAKNVLAPFLNSDNGEVSEGAMDIFLKGTRFIADIVRDVLNRYAIPQLVNYNWNVDEYPELKVRRIGETVDLRTLSFALRNFIGADAIRPDDQVEDWIRYEMDMPKPDVATTRKVVAPQSPSEGEGGPGTQGGPGSPKPPAVGPPRQATAGNMNKGTGRLLPDKSGGS